MSKEKSQVVYVDSGSEKDGQANGYYHGDDGGVAGYDRTYEAKLIRKVDYRLLPILGALYAISLIDRVNVRALTSPSPSPVPFLLLGRNANIPLKISNANVAGMGADLNLQVGSRYSIVLVVFFIPYFIFETICLRSLAVFYLFSVLVGGFSSILAYGLMQMEGLGHERGWRWIFVSISIWVNETEHVADWASKKIIEGLLTQVIAILAWFVIIDFPDKAHQKKGFITSQDAEFIKKRINNDRGDAIADMLTTKKLKKHLLDWKLWSFAFMFMSTTMPAYAFAYFVPIIIKGMGYTAGVANLLAAPPVISAVVSAFAFAWVGDRYRMRGPLIAFQAIVTIVGLMITAYHKKNSVRYFGIFLGYAGCQGNIPAILAYQSNNIRLQSKRAVGSALQIGFGAIGGIIASTTFREKDAPRFLIGLWVTAGLQFLILCILTCTTLYFHHQNKKVDSGELAELEGQSGFRYTL
ncbi:hypothetical protein GP486_002819 [Trichoglossum hirsutum]|uniref:Major facilitator superfamily (MFS) profile domain-containing protein n=1 Tax=Trichoglossum hirsutum TaxID=265104 RepID=A0A9P8LE92_9PEZI|nr:hypothetical protein GP486_002819 [Trichoglossum hirsutum]